MQPLWTFDTPVMSGLAPVTVAGVTQPILTSCFLCRRGRVQPKLTNLGMFCFMVRVQVKKGRVTEGVRPIPYPKRLGARNVRRE